MNFAVTGIDHQPLEVRIVDEAFQQCLPNTLVAPTTESPMSVLPVAISWWQITPRRPGSQNPNDCIDESPIVPGYTTPLPHLARQMGFEQGPMSVGKVVALIGFGRRHLEKWPR
jgi:hypothetical protein